MCGIVGHIGAGNSVERVLQGLERLEYRGYDSAGICFRNKDGPLSIYKKQGKLENLLKALKDVKMEGFACIGHTRWATHGQVNDINSHPHGDENLALIHNGIIENASELRKSLQAKGVLFHSETDSEIFLALLKEELQKGQTILQAVTLAFERIEGNSAFVILHRKDQEMVAIKRGTPLVCCVNKDSGEAMVSSDPYALMDEASKIYFPEDEVICQLGPFKLDFFERDGSDSSRYKVGQVASEEGVSQKGPFEHFMLKEIHQQPALIRTLIDKYFQEDWEKVVERPSRIHLVGCGTAYYAGLLIFDFFEKILKIPCNASLASEFRYRTPLFFPNDLALFISQSGETADTLAALALCREHDVKTATLVNVEGSTLFREGQENYLIHAGREIGVASTKAFTQQVLTGRILCEKLSGEKKVEELKQKLSLLALRLEELLAQADIVKKVAEEIYQYKGFFFTGRGKYFPAALEGALKLKEIAYVHAEGYASGELKHGPIALIDENIVNIAIVGPELFEKSLSNLQEVKARRGVIVGIGPKKKELEELCDFFLPLNFEGLEELSPLLVNVVNQLLAYYVAKQKGTDIDRPRNLAKSVTVE